MKVLDKIKVEEGFRERKYKCSQGYPTIGFGTKLPLSEKELKLLSKTRGYKITNCKINYGLKLTVKEAEMLLNGRLEPLLAKLNDLRVFLDAPDSVRVVLCDMGYQMGFNGLCAFKNMLQAIEDKNFGIASDELMDSRYAKQTPKRAKRNAKLIKSI